ncbi:MAG: BACON domain-containing protein [Paludibacteraceae bacterium]|nr:BACON domain-containing protein [Paludibacteraceae bacterium]
MKKFTLVACALATTVASFAVPFGKVVRDTRNYDAVQKVATFDAEKAQKNVTATDTIQVPYMSYTPTFRVGKPSSGLSYDFFQQGLVSAYADTIILLNDSMYPATWVLGENVLAENAWYTRLPVHFGENDLPVMKLNEKADTYMFDWQVAGLYLRTYWEGYDQFYTALNVAPAQYTPITQCARYTENPAENEYGVDLYQVGAGSYGTYSYGTQLTNPWQSTTKMDSMIVVFENNGNVMNIDHITAGIYTAGGSGDAMFPGENDHVRLSIYPGGFNAQGSLYVDWANPIAEATANADNVTLSTDQKGNALSYGLIKWEFMEEDPVTGAQTPAPIVVEGSFVVLLDEYNDGTANFGFHADYYGNGTYCRTFFPWFDYSEGKQYTSRVWGSNILLNVVALFPVFNAPEKVNFELAGGELTLDIPSNVWDDEIELEADEWINAEIATDYEEIEEDGETYYEHKYVNHLTITVGQSSEDRVGTIELDALGLPVTIKVVQGEDTEAVENVNASAAKVSKSFIDGQLIIERNGVRYNATGAQISK